MITVDRATLKRIYHIPLTYIVYVDSDDNQPDRIYHTTCDLNEAITYAQKCAGEGYPGEAVHIAARIRSFVSEIAVKEISHEREEGTDQ